MSSGQFHLSGSKDSTTFVSSTSPSATSIGGSSARQSNTTGQSYNTLNKPSAPTSEPASQLQNPLANPSQPPPTSTSGHIIPPLLQRVASLRGTLTRRRSSFPPSNVDQNGLTPAAVTQSRPSLDYTKSQLDLFAELGLPELASMWTPVGWDTLLNFDGDSKEVNPFATPVASTSSPAVGGGMARVSSDPGRNRRSVSGPVREGTGSRAEMAAAGPASLERGRAAPMGSDLAWRTILASQVDVDGVGHIGVARVLQEVWRKGGGDSVTSQGAWQSIIQALSLPEDGSPNFHLHTPSAHSALALQNLYNLTLRHWEPSIFTGLLSSFGSQALQGDLDLTAMLGAAAQANQMQPAAHRGEHVFGVATPQKELDMSQWTNLTPGGGADWSFLNDYTDSPPSKSQSTLVGTSHVPSSLAYEVRDTRRGSTARSIDDEGVRGLDEILAQMEEGVEARDIAAVQAKMQAASANADTGSSSGRKRPAGQSPFQMPTPETDSSDTTCLSGRGQFSASASGSNSDRNRQQSFNIVTPPSSNGSPLTSSNHLILRPPGGQSAISRHDRLLPTPTPSTESLPRITGGKKKKAMQLDMPMATFVPPPPMCMFFSPAFHDLQNGKVGVWKGDLEVRGKGGGKFSVLIVGEAATGHMWQSNIWPKDVVYPPESQAGEEATATATMIPVSHLAREGFTPAAMGMVLCNDANIEAYVQMVQGLHAEGVGFHLSTPSRLPIVFLPAKFDSNDPLQRLGIAFMTKPGVYPTTSASMASSRSGIPSTSAMAKHAALSSASTAVDDGEPKKKKRRQSAPAGTLPPPKTTMGRHKKGDSSISAVSKAMSIPEEEAEEQGS